MKRGAVGQARDREQLVRAGFFQIDLGLARVVGSLLLLVGIGLGAATGRWQTVGVLALYVALTVSYSVWLKHVAVVDLVAVATQRDGEERVGRSGAACPWTAEELTRDDDDPASAHGLERNNRRPLRSREASRLSRLDSLSSNASTRSWSRLFGSLCATRASSET